MNLSRMLKQGVGAASRPGKPAVAGKPCPDSNRGEAKLGDRGLSFAGGVALLVLSLAAAVRAAPPLSDPVREADDYYLGRAKLENVREGMVLLREAVRKNAQDYETWWRISRFACYLARHASGAERSRDLEEGIEAGKKAVALQPNHVEGHFWLGANYGLSAEAGGMLTGLRLVDAIRKEMETVERLDPSYEQAAGLRTLARVYYRAPFFKGGDKRRSVELLEECLRRFPENSLTMLYLADSYQAVGRRADARRILERMLQLCPDPLYGPELAENQGEARARLARFGR